MRDRLITVNGKRWILRFRNLRSSKGYCEAPWRRRKVIGVQRSLRGEERLEVLVHELLHASAWDLLSEHWVTIVAKDIARILYGLGYRANGDTEGKSGQAETGED